MSKRSSATKTKKKKMKRTKRRADPHKMFTLREIDIRVDQRIEVLAEPGQVTLTFPDKKKLTMHADVTYGLVNIINEAAQDARAFERCFQQAGQKARGEW